MTLLYGVEYRSCSILKGSFVLMKTPFEINNYPAGITSASKNFTDKKLKDASKKTAMVSLPDIRDMSEKIKI